MANTDFSLTDVTDADIPAMVDMTLEGWADDGVWQGMMRNVARKDSYDLLARIHKARVGKPGGKYFGIREKDTGKLVAWTALFYPQPDQPAGQKKSMPKPDIRGMDEHMATIFFGTLMRASGRYGYDPAEHFHRRGTFTHADYQRRGFATWLTQHCNAIADEAGRATFVGCRPASKGVFEKCGFRVVAAIDVDVKGDGSEMDVQYVMRREPEAK